MLYFLLTWSALQWYQGQYKRKTFLAHTVFKRATACSSSWTSPVRGSVLTRRCSTYIVTLRWQFDSLLCSVQKKYIYCVVTQVLFKPKEWHPREVLKAQGEYSGMIVESSVWPKYKPVTRVTCSSKRLDYRWKRCFSCSLLHRPQNLRAWNVENVTICS